MKMTLKKLTLPALLLISASSLRAQDSTKMSTTSAPAASTSSTGASSLLSGKKSYNTFSIGINGGVLAPVSATGGTNGFTKWKPTLGYGAYIRNQFTHYLALQADYVGGTLEGNNENELGNGGTTNNPYSSFKTKLHWAASLSAQVTFGNINWLSDKNMVIPYVSAGAGWAGYRPYLNDESIDYNAGKDITEFFIPAGVGLKFIASEGVNIDLGYRMNFVDGDNLDGYNMGSNHKDRFSYGFAGVEFVLGKKGNQQLLAHNPVADLKMDLMDANNAAKQAQAAAEASTSKISSLEGQISQLKMDSDKDGVADYLDKCPNTPDTVKVDGSGCPLPKMAPPPPPAQTVIITEEDRRIVSDAIKNLEFETGKSTIRERSYSSLDRVAEILVKKNFSLKLAGHTDNVGSDASNLKLSKDRAESVKAYLVSKGANPSRIEATGYGESQPIASNKTAAGRQQNRRVEFTLF